MLVHFTLLCQRIAKLPKTNILTKEPLPMNNNTKSSFVLEKSQSQNFGIGLAPVVIRQFQNIEGAAPFQYKTCHLYISSRFAWKNGASQSLKVIEPID